jgi:hypothetical protein
VQTRLQTSFGEIKNQKAPPALRRRWGCFVSVRGSGGQQEVSDLLEDGLHGRLTLEEERVVCVVDPSDRDVLLAWVARSLHEQVVAWAHGQDWTGERIELDPKDRREDLQRRLSLLRVQAIEHLARKRLAVRIVARHHDVLDLLDRAELDSATQVRTQNRNRGCEHGADRGPEESNTEALHSAEQGATDEQLRAAHAHRARELRSQRVRDEVRALVGDVSELADHAVDMIVVGVAFIRQGDHLPSGNGSEEPDDQTEEESDMIERLVPPCSGE